MSIIHAQFQHLSQLLLMHRKEQANPATTTKNILLQCNQLATLDQSAMFLNNGVASTSSRKRKTQDVAETRQFTAMNIFSTTSGIEPYGQNKQQPESISMAVPFKSFTSLLIGDDHDSEDTVVPLKLEDQIGQMIKTHGDQLRRTLADTWRMHYSALLCAAEERAAKRLREKEFELETAVRKNAELEKSAARFKSEAQVWEFKATRMERAVASLTEALQKANKGCFGGGREEEDAESSHVDPERVEAAAAAASRVMCRGCQMRAATVMMWPCRHVCVCLRCDATTQACPVCVTPKTASVEVFLTSA